MTSLSLAEILKLNCNQLRTELRKADLDTKGKKADLQERLQKHLQECAKKTDDDKENSPPPKKKFDPTSIVCGLTKELPKDPVYAEDGCIYDRKAIQKHIDKRITQKRVLKSPVTKEPMGPRLTSAPQHKDIILQFIESGALKGDLVSKWNARLEKTAKIKKYVEDLLELANNGNTDAMRLVALNYMLGKHGFETDEELGFSYYRKAHEAGDVSATALLGCCFFDGIGVEQCNTQGSLYIGMASGKGSQLAAWLLAEIFADGRYGMKVNKPEAIRWLQIVVGGNCAVKDLSEDSVKKARELLDELMEVAN